jgi:Taurine catabolism dioxygenase TauD, TfdA family
MGKRTTRPRPLPNDRLAARRRRPREAPMTVDTRMRFAVVPLSKHIGAEIRGLDLREKPDNETIRAIYQAWLDHLVIVFPGQTLSQEDLLRVTGYCCPESC